MGNYLALCTVGDLESKEELLKEKRVLQIITVDGKILEFTSPVIVRDLLVKYPKFYVGVFNKATQALPLDYKLKVGKIYYLLPSSVIDDNHTAATSNEDDEDARREMDVRTTTKKTTIKVVITKEQLQQILQKQGRVEELLPNNKVWSSEDCSSSSSSSSSNWFPKLESIPEGNCDVVC